MALAHKYRLTHKKDIDAVFTGGKTVRGSFFFYKYARNELGHIRIAVAVPAKTSTKTTERNRMRRQVHSSLPLDEIVNTPVDVVMVLTTTILKKAHGEIKDEICKGMAKLYS